MGSGKTFFANWLMGLQGYAPTKGLGLGKGSFVTVPGLCAQLENYSCLLVWFDEYREHEITSEKIAVIRAAYDRQMANKWTPDGVQRVIRTTPLVSGETTTGDPATHSRYTHLQLSRQERLADHLPWLRDNRHHFVRFWQFLMENRPLFVELVMKNTDLWFTSKKTESLPERSRATYALSYAAFRAAVTIFESHTAEEVDAFGEFLVQRAGVSAADVDHEKFVNVFIQDILTAYDAGAIPNDLFRVEADKEELDELGFPWQPFKIYFEPFGVIDALQIHLRKANRNIPLRYKDMRDQLSKNKKFWIQSDDPKNPIKKRFGPVGGRASKGAWGIRVDGHPLGRQPCTREEVEAALDKRQLYSATVAGLAFKDGDPRKGPLFSIVEGVTRWEEDADKEK